MQINALKDQPKGFHLIALLETWERFGFYGVQALLVFFMVQHLDYSDTFADMTFAAFGGIVYILPAIGGYIGDHWLGTKRTILLGAIILAGGYGLLSIPAISNHNLTLPLAVIGIGNGLFKANPSSLLSKLYQGNNLSADSGFTLYYMAVNVGALVALTLTPVLNHLYGWHVAYGVCCLGLVAAIINYLCMIHLVKDFGSEPDFQPLSYLVLFVVILGSLVMVPVIYYLLNHHNSMTLLVVLSTSILFGIFFFHMSKATERERKGMLLFVILFCEGIVFFLLYFQMPTSLNLYALRNVTHHLLGIPIQAANFQALNAFWILVLSPILAHFYQKMENNNYDISMPIKFAAGMFLCAAAFLVLPLAGQFAVQGVVSSNWLILSYFFQSMGELFISALGLALVARYIPQRLMGYTMGLWFLGATIASLAAGKVASLASIPKSISHVPTESLPVYSHLFLEIGLCTLALAFVMLIFVKPLNRLAKYTVND